MSFLFLDDMRKPSDVEWVNLPALPWDIVKNYDEFVDYIDKNGIPKIVSFDHDLHPEHYKFNPNLIMYKDYFSKMKYKTGYNCLEYMVNKIKEEKLEHPEMIYIHTLNQTGAKWMVSLLRNNLILNISLI